MAFQVSDRRVGYILNKSENDTPEMSSTMRALQRALVSVIITLLDDSERSLNKKWLCPVTNKSNTPLGWKSKRKILLPSFKIVPYHISTQRNIHRHSKNRI